MKQPLFMQAMQGLGDSVYLRAVVREMVEFAEPLYLETSWPQFFTDLPIQCIKPVTKLHAQAKNVARRDLRWAPRPNRNAMPWGVVHYVSRPDLSILQALCAAVKLPACTLKFDLPSFARHTVPCARPHVIVRPATLRSEWPADSRNPLPEYIDRAARALARHFHVISIADLYETNMHVYERAVDPLPFAHERYHKGELQVEQMLGLVQTAAAVVGGVGWLAPVAVAYRVPMLLLYGGWGKHNGPRRLFDAAMDTSMIHQLLPHPFCMCAERSHTCNKIIEGFDAKLEQWVTAIASRKQVDLAA